jgi:hypothetical protein
MNSAADDSSAQRLFTSARYKLHSGVGLYSLFISRSIIDFWGETQEPNLNITSTILKTRPSSQTFQMGHACDCEITRAKRNRLHVHHVRTSSNRISPQWPSDEGCLHAILHDDRPLTAPLFFHPSSRIRKHSSRAPDRKTSKLRS